MRHLFFGFVAGIALAGTAAWAIRPSSAEANPPGTQASPPGLASAHVENLRLRAERDAMRAKVEAAAPANPTGEIAALERQIAEMELKLVARHAPPEKLELARKIHKVYVALMSGSQNPADGLKLMQWLKEADEDMAPFFVEKFREAATPQERVANFMLLLYCGGSQVAGVVSELTAGSTLDGGERATLLSQVGMSGVIASMSYGLPPPRPFPVDEALAATAFRLSRSEIGLERVGAAGLLGWHDAPASLETLRAMAERDSESNVRAAAIASLGRVGNRAALAWLLELQALESPEKEDPGDQVQQMNAHLWKATIKSSIKMLKKRFPD